jgi:hypothetical protein
MTYGNSTSNAEKEKVLVGWLVGWIKLARAWMPNDIDVTESRSRIATP